jgi:hypothetical protein
VILAPPATQVPKESQVRRVLARLVRQDPLVARLERQAPLVRLDRGRRDPQVVRV